MNPVFAFFGLGAVESLLILAGLATLVYGYFAPQSAPGKIIHTILAQFGMGAQNYKAQHAVANYNAALRRKASTVGRGVHNLGERNALIASATRELNDKLTDAADLREEIRLAQEEGVSDDDPHLQTQAEELMDIQERIGTLQAKLKEYGQSREQTTAQLVAMRRQVESGQRRARELSTDLRDSELSADLAKQSAAFDPDAGHDTMQDAEDLVLSQIDKNKGIAQATAEVLGSSTNPTSRRVKARKTKDFLASLHQQDTAQNIANDG